MTNQKVKDAMTARPICCTRTDTTVTAARLMRDHDTGIIPVIDGDARPILVGVVTDRDVCLNVVAEDRVPREVHVQRCMTKNVVCCDVEDTLDTAITLMRESQVRRILVVDRDRVIQGILSMADLVGDADVDPAEAKATLRKVSEPTNQPSKPRSAQSYRETV